MKNYKFILSIALALGGLLAVASASMAQLCSYVNGIAARVELRRFILEEDR